MKCRPTPLRSFVSLFSLLVISGLSLRAADAPASAPAASSASAQAAASSTAPTRGRTPTRKDADGRTLQVTRNTGHVTNYYEEKIPDYTLPDPLKLASGVPVADADTWYKFRRPEILNYYKTEIYGRVPASAPKVTFTVASTDPQALNGTAIHKQIVGHFGGPDGPTMTVEMFLPAKATGPVPLILSLSFGFGAVGNPSSDLSLPGVDPTAAPALPPAGTRAPSTPEPVADILTHGYGYAVVRYTQIEGDSATGSLNIVRKLALMPGQEKPDDDEWGTISAWGWGLSRIMDYLETDQAVDAKRVAIVGHSRLGKTVLWAGAADPRFAMVFSSQGGELGSSIGRRDFGESIDDMAQNFGYQFAGNLQKYVGHWNNMPVDTHMLISLIAPRPLLITGGTGDQWSDPHGEFLGEVGAARVYRLLGAKDLGTTEWPKPETPLISGDLAYYLHTGPHDITKEDWAVFLNFADRYWKSAPKNN